MILLDLCRWVTPWKTGQLRRLKWFIWISLVFGLTAAAAAVAAVIVVVDSSQITDKILSASISLDFLCAVWRNVYRELHISVRFRSSRFFLFVAWRRREVTAAAAEVVVVTKRTMKTLDWNDSGDCCESDEIHRTASTGSLLPAWREGDCGWRRPRMHSGTVAAISGKRRLDSAPIELKAVSDWLIGSSRALAQGDESNET